MRPIKIFPSLGNLVEAYLCHQGSKISRWWALMGVNFSSVLLSGWGAAFILVTHVLQLWEICRDYLIDGFLPSVFVILSFLHFSSWNAVPPQPVLSFSSFFPLISPLFLFIHFIFTLLYFYFIFPQLFKISVESFLTFRSILFFFFMKKKSYFSKDLNKRLQSFSRHRLCFQTFFFFSLFILNSNF